MRIQIYMRTRPLVVQESSVDSYSTVHVCVILHHTNVSIFLKIISITLVSQEKMNAYKTVRTYTS